MRRTAPKSSQTKKLKARLVELESTLEAIRSGNVDALMVATPQGEQVFTLRDADRPYRVMVEQMAEGAVTFSHDGTILFCNQRLADILNIRLENLLASNIFEFILPDNATFLATLHGVNGTTARIEVLLRRIDGYCPASVSLARLGLSDSEAAYCMVVNDMTDRRRLERQVQEVSEREQQRLGQDLHDGLGQALVGITYMLQNFKSKVSEAPHTKQLDSIIDLLKRTQDQTRELARGFYPVELERHGLRSALIDLSSQMQGAFRMKCRVSCDKCVDQIDRDAQIHVFRIVQESIRNAAHHGKAKNIEVKASRAGSEVHITIQNNGLRFAPAKPPGKTKHSRGMGLKIMEYRAHIIGGLLSIEPGRTRGCVVRCSVPLPRK